MATIKYTSMENLYFTSNGSEFFDKAGDWGENFDHILGIGQHTSFFFAKALELQNDTVGAKKCHDVSNAFGAADSALGVVRVIPALEKFTTGKAFWKREDDGTWVRDKEGNYIRRDFIDIVIDTLCVAGRILSPIYWFHRNCVYDLGMHADRMSNAMLGIWGAVISLSIVQDVRKINQEFVDGNMEKMRESIANLVCDILSLIALPFDFGYGMSGHPALALTGAAFNMAAKGGCLIVKEYYR